MFPYRLRIGKQYTENKHKRNKNKYQEDKTDETYRLPNGAKSALPIYYRNKIYTDEEKEKLWINKLNKQERYINGTKISVKNGEELYYKVLKTAQETNTGDMEIRDNMDWTVYQ